MNAWKSAGASTSMNASPLACAISEQMSAHRWGVPFVTPTQGQHESPCTLAFAMIARKSASVA